MKLKKILKGLECRVLAGDLNQDITDIAIHSKKVSPNSLFVAIPGFKTDGHRFAQEAVGKGAAAVIVQKPLELPLPIVQILVADTRKSLAVVSGNFFSHPSRKIIIVGVTGTNGKTTTCFLINSIIRETGVPNSLITTVRSYMGEKQVAFDRTTPDSLELNRFFAQSTGMGIKHACMEVSSHSVDLGRVDDLNFDGFVFTNLSQDHLDYHRDMESYFQAKQKLFLKENRHTYGGKFAVINSDDAYGKIVLGNTDLNATSYAIHDAHADLRAGHIRNSIQGIAFDLYQKNRLMGHIESALSGIFNVYNILAAIGVAMNLGISYEKIKKGIQALKGVPGRFQKVDVNAGFTVIVDYAHTPDGLENVLTTAKKLLPKHGKLITVFGCGGDRDKQKRPMMGKISSKYSDFSIITSDNPRSETPLAIMGMIAKGFDNTDKYVEVEDRKKAIQEALCMAKDHDIIVIAGKGHEDYQEFKDHRIHFSDQEMVMEILNQNGKN